MGGYKGVGKERRVQPQALKGNEERNGEGCHFQEVTITDATPESGRIGERTGFGSKIIGSCYEHAESVYY